MTHTEMFGSAQWLQATDDDCTSPLFRGTFQAAAGSKAAMRICGLGFFALWVNGKRVSADLLVPVNSGYSRRDLSLMEYPIYDDITFRIYAVEYDLTDYLLPGENTIGVQLGTGWYAQSLRSAEGDVAFGRCKLCYTVSVTEADGTQTQTVSDESVRWSESELIFNNLYMGEHYDFALRQNGWNENGFDDSGWQSPAIVPAPESILDLQTCPPDRVIRSITPCVLRAFEDITVYDCGENITGYAAVRTADGESVTVCYSEEAFTDGRLDYASCGGEWQIQTNRYDNCVAGQEMTPRFCWHGFRYFSVTNNAEVLRVEVVHSDTPVTSAFESDNDELNWLYETYIRTQLCNMHAGVPSDCPHIERLGYTGDGQLCAESGMLLLDSRAFYRKWLTDISDCQDKCNGHIQHTAPFAGGGGGPGGWGGAVVVVPWVYYKQYGDTDVLREFLPKMLHYFDYMESRSENGLVVREEKGGWCLGDWCTPGGIMIPEPYVNTSLYVKFMQMAQDIAAILGEDIQSAQLDSRIARCQTALANAYFSPQTHHFIGNLQGADSYALDIGLGDGETLPRMLKKYQESGQFDTGIIATDILTRLLFARNEAALAFTLLASKGENSFYNMKKQGATTLWEYWDGTRSHSHPMFGAVTRLLFTGFLGIGQAADSAGYEKIVIAPQLVPQMSRCAGHVTTVRGKIAVAYERGEGETVFTVTLDESLDGFFRCGDTECALHGGVNRVVVAQA